MIYLGTEHVSDVEIAPGRRYAIVKVTNSNMIPHKRPLELSAISQNQPGIIEIKGLKTSHFKESKAAPLDRGEIGSMGHVECPQSELDYARDTIKKPFFPCRATTIDEPFFH
jgi:hypothetical protein